MRVALVIVIEARGSGTSSYAGFIGSRRKVRMILDQVHSDGVAAEKVQALKAPIGLEIGAETPAEIAVAILAEIIAVRRDSLSQGA